jgi:hypothetical protein
MLERASSQGTTWEPTCSPSGGIGTLQNRELRSADTLTFARTPPISPDMTAGRDGSSITMKDLHAKLEKLLVEAEDCELIGRLATEPEKRETFRRLSLQLREMAEELRQAIAEAGPAVAEPPPS